MHPVRQKNLTADWRLSAQVVLPGQESSHCQLQLVHSGRFNVSGERNEQLAVEGEGTTVWDFCLSYACNSERRAWAVAAWACVCFDEAAVRAADSAMPPDLARCCPDTLQMHFGSCQEDIQGRARTAQWRGSHARAPIQ